MNHRTIAVSKRVAFRIAVAMGAMSAAHLAFASEGYVDLRSSGKVLTRCNPRSLPARDKCRVSSLPGLPGYTQVASRSSPIIKNDVTVGTLYDKVWKDNAGNYIFGMRAQMNANVYDLTGLAFNVNDMFRQVLEAKSVSVAYNMGPATKALKKAGRTLQGLNEPAPEDDDNETGTDDQNFTPDFTGPDKQSRDNGWVDFRVDANAAEVSGSSSASSPWVLAKTKAPSGYSLQSFAIRLLSSDFPDRSQHIEIFLSGYKPN